MLEFNNVSVSNFGNAMRGARNPMNSWSRSDSMWLPYEKAKELTDEYDAIHKYRDLSEDPNEMCFVLGENDMDLAKRLANAGSAHRKFMRQMNICVDVDAPLYWWKEYDTYKVGTVANSCSTMHKIQAAEINMEMISHDQMLPEAYEATEKFMSVIEEMRQGYLANKDNPELQKQYWYSMIQMLPSSWNQLRTLTFSYEGARSMYGSRQNHKQYEWSKDMMNMLKTLPYFKLLIECEPC